MFPHPLPVFNLPLVQLFEWMSLCNMDEARQMMTLRTRTNDAYPVLLLLIKEKGTISLADMCIGWSMFLGFLNSVADQSDCLYSDCSCLVTCLSDRVCDFIGGILKT